LCLVTGGVSTGFSFLGALLKKGFESHYVITALDGYPLKKTDQIPKKDIEKDAIILGNGSSRKFYDEIVVTQENQILPAFILQFDPVYQRQLFTAYKSELMDANQSISNESNKESLEEVVLQFAPRLRADMLTDDEFTVSITLNPSELSVGRDYVIPRDSDPLLRSGDRLIVNEI
jgi:hypothetical protein